MPGVVLVTADFADGARSVAGARGHRELPVVVLPADLDQLDEPGVRAVLAEVWPRISAGLRRC